MNLKKYRRNTALKIYAVLFLVLLFITNIANKVDAATYTPGAFPDSWMEYTLATGALINDPIDEAAGNSFADITSGSTNSLGSVKMASNGVNVFFRMRLLTTPADTAAKGGFQSSQWSVAIGVNGVQTAVVGVDGRTSTNNDRVYVSNADGSVVTTIYEYNTNGYAMARGLSDGAGQFYLDFQVPISAITALAPSITATTPVQLFYGTSQAANLSVINKDYMIGGSVAFANLSVITLTSMQTVTISGGENANSTSSYPTIRIC